MLCHNKYWTRKQVHTWFPKNWHNISSFNIIPKKRTCYWCYWNKLTYHKTNNFIYNENIITKGFFLLNWVESLMFKNPFLYCPVINIPTLNCFLGRKLVNFLFGFSNVQFFSSVFMKTDKTFVNPWWKTQYKSDKFIWLNIDFVNVFIICHQSFSNAFLLLFCSVLFNLFI